MKQDATLLEVTGRIDPKKANIFAKDAKCS
jgi:hypothetical protein